jgi:hypothetical protein
MGNIPKVSVAFSNGNLLQNIAAIDGYGGIVGTGTATEGITLGTPFVINSLAELEALGALENYRAAAAEIAAVSAVSAATGNLTISAPGTDGDEFVVLVGDDEVGSYTKVIGDTTATAVATAIRAAVNAATGTNGGYTAGGSGANVTIIAPSSAGANINGTAGYITYPGGSVTSNFTGGVTAADLVPAVTENDTADLYKHVKEFYTEVGGNQQLYILLLDRGVTMAQMLDITNLNYAYKLINFADGEISKLAVFRKPASGYNAGTEFVDTDVPAAVTAAKTFVQGFNLRNFYFRVLIEGRIASAGSPTIYEPNEAANGFAGVVLGGTKNNGTASVGMALGRSMAYACHIKLGKVANGALSATEIYIGTTALKSVTNLDALHGKGYISFVTYPNKAGFYFGIDNMASTDDYRILVNGAVVDATAKVALAVYIEELESEVDTNPNGTIQELDALDLEARIVQQVQVTLGERISGIEALVDRTVNIINTSKADVKLRVRPKGYLTFIDVDLGLTAGT